MNDTRKHITQLLDERAKGNNTEVDISIYTASDAKETTQINNLATGLKCTINILETGNDDTEYNKDNTFIRYTGDDAKIQRTIHMGWGGVNSDDKNDRDFNNFRAAIFKYNHDGKENSFILTPVLPNEGDAVAKRIKQAQKAINFLYKLGMREITVCALTGTRESWKTDSKLSARYFRGAEILWDNLRERLKSEKDTYKELVVTYHPAENSGENGNRDEIDLAFEIEKAIEKADIIIPFNGSAGNLLVRSFHWLSDRMELYSIPWFVDNDEQVWPIGEGGFNNDSHERHMRRAILWHHLRNENRASE